MSIEMSALSRRALLTLPAAALAANERITIGFIGAGRQASYLFKNLLSIPQAQVIAIADVNLARARAFATRCQGEAVQDYRRLLDRRDLDAIVTATPEHWRALTVIHAAQAGKDIYAEKPMTLTIREGRLMANAIQRHRRILQCGSQQRSQRENQAGCALIRSGKLGRITRVIAHNYPSPWECALPAQAIPAELDWNAWCGPVQPVPYHQDLYLPRAKPGWLSFRPYSGGEMTGWGAHGLDQVQCALGMDSTGPVEIWTEGPPWNPPTYRQSESADRGNQLCSAAKLFYRYANGIILELADGPAGGAIFIGEKGRVTIDPRQAHLRSPRTRRSSPGEHPRTRPHHPPPTLRTGSTPSRPAAPR